MALATTKVQDGGRLPLAKVMERRSTVAEMPQ